MYPSVEQPVKIGMNQAIQIVPCDYAIASDFLAFERMWKYLNKDLKLVMSRRVFDAQLKCPTFDPRSGISAVHKLHECKEVFALWFCQHSERPHDERIHHSCGILSSALSLAYMLGCEEVYLVGVDFWRFRDKEYAFDILPAKVESLEPIGDGVYTAPSYEAMKHAISGAVSEWDGMPIYTIGGSALSGIFPERKFE